MMMVMMMMVVVVCVPLCYSNLCPALGWSCRTSSPRSGMWGRCRSGGTSLFLEGSGQGRCSPPVWGLRGLIDFGSDPRLPAVNGKID